MKFTSLEIEDIKLFEPLVHFDNRGYFFESFNEKEFKKHIHNFYACFIQDNIAFSSQKGTLRGLHYQERPFEQGKLITVLKGKIFDVAVDLRKKSKTYGQYVSVVLSSKNKKSLWVPPGFAHGYLTLVDNTEILYKVTNKYSPKYELTIKYDDPFFQINWPRIGEYFLSIKDLEASYLKI